MRSLPVSLPLEILIASPTSSILTTWLVHLNLLDLITLTLLDQKYKLWISFLWRLFHSLSFLFSLNICLSILFSNFLSLHSFLNVRDNVLQPYNTTGNAIVLHILILNIFQRNLQDKVFWLNNNIKFLL